MLLARSQEEATEARQDEGPTGHQGGPTGHQGGPCVGAISWRVYVAKGRRTMLHTLAWPRWGCVPEPRSITTSP